jgi:two-component system sensor histidine kinase and response regulator WspE
VSGLEGYGDSTMLELFREEAEAQIAVLSDGLVALESSGDPASLLEQLMRAAHSMKGAARIADIDPVVKLTHVAEDIFVAAQRAELEIDKHAIDVLLATTDLIIAIVSEQGVENLDGQVESLLVRLKAIRSGEAIAADAKEASTSTSDATVEDNSTPATLEDDLAHFSLLELFAEEAAMQIASLSDGLIAIEGGGDLSDVLEELMRSAHSIKGAARIVGLEPVVKVAHLLEDIFVAAQKNTLQLNTVDVDVALRAVDFMNAIAQGALSTSDGGEGLALLLEQLSAVRNGELIEPIPKTKDTSFPDTSSQKLHKKKPDINKVSRSPAAANATRPAAAKAIKMTTETLERLTGMTAEAVVESSRMERIVDEFSELGIEHRKLDRMLTELRRGLEDQDGVAWIDEALGLALEQLGGCARLLAKRDEKLELYARRNTSLANRLSREALASRMLPFGTILRGYPRLVRDIGNQLGKVCRLQLKGESTLIDREILEKLDSALNHIVRNALDHGLESPADRIAAGKPGEATITLEAFHQAGRLRVLVSDDGRGIDPEKIRASIIKKGLESQQNAAQLSIEELQEFLFLPGFSTAAAVTEISGRGVGLDSVRTMVQESGGKILLHSEQGVATRFDIELPVTRSVARVLLLRISKETYAVPIAGIEYADVVSASRLKAIEGRVYFDHKNQQVALISAAEILELPDSSLSETRDEIPVVIMREGARLYALEVEELLGERDLIVRTLDPRLGDVPDVAAISTDESGSIVLILDIDEMIRNMEALISGGRLVRRSDVANSQTAGLKRILVVDDSLTVRQAERQLLTNAGYEVDVAVDGLEAWSAVRLADYDLVVSDVDMPRMNGIELAGKIRNEGRNKEIPIIIVSYKERPEDRLKGMEAGANYYLTKSGFQDSSLLDAVQDLIGGPRQSDN